MSNKVIPTDSVNQDAWRPAARRLRRRSIIREFALNASAHALPGIARSQSKHNRIFWTISFLAFLGVMLYFVVESIKNYFTYPTQTIISVGGERSQTFPAVTFCNYAPVRYDRLRADFLNYTNSMNITHTNDTAITTLQQATALREFLRENLNTNQSLTKYFFAIDDMLIECSYNSVPCSSKDFISFLSSYYGACYTFNAKLKNSTNGSIRYTNELGGSGNLRLKLYAHSHQYVPFITGDVSAGMVAMIHDNTQLPRIEVAGIELAPGRKHKLGYKKKANYFLPAPYTDCTDEIPVDMQEMFDQYGGADYAYSQTVCFILCTQAFIYQQCHCVNPQEWSARSIVLPGTQTVIEAPLCRSADRCYPIASTILSNTTSIWNEFCSHCTQECSQISYTVTPSSLAAPSTVYAFATKAFVESSSVALPSNWASNWLTEVEKSFVGLEVVCESIQVDNYTQEASVSAVDVLSNVGGHTGLWIGISFLSITEVIEMLYRLLRQQYRIVRHAT